MTSAQLENGKCITTAQYHKLQTPYTATEHRETATTNDTNPFLAFFSFLGMPTCVEGNETAFITMEVLETTLHNTLLTATDPKLQTTSLVPSRTNTSAPISMTVLPQSNPSKTPTDTNTQVKVGVGVTIPVYIIAMATLGIFLRWWYRLRSRSTMLHEGPAIQTQTLQPLGQQPFLELKAELEAKERHELEAVERRYEIQGAERRLEVSAGEVSQELADCK